MPKVNIIDEASCITSPETPAFYQKRKTDKGMNLWHLRWQTPHWERLPEGLYCHILERTGQIWEARGLPEVGVREGRALKYRSVQEEFLSKTLFSMDSPEGRTVGLRHQIKAKKWQNEDKMKV